MRLQAIRSHYGLGGNVQAVGSLYDAPDVLARQLIAAGKAIAAPADMPRPARSVKPKPMTVASVPALVPGATEQKGTEP
jgi:hypothetical protein